MNQDPPPEAGVWLQAYRHKTINLLLGSICLLGTAGLLFSFYQAWSQDGFQFSFLLGYYLIAYFVVLILFFVHQIPDRWRAIGFITLVYLFSVFALYSGWLGGSGRVFLLPFIVLAAVLVGSTAGIVAAILSLATYVGFGIAYVQGWLVYSLAPGLADPGIILIEGIGFAMAVGLIVIGLRFFRQGLNASNASNLEIREARELLSERAKELDDTNQLLAEHSQKLEYANAAFELQNWYNSGQSFLYKVMRGEQEISILADNVLNQLCNYLNFPIGSLFILEEDVLMRVGKYAFPSESTIADRFNLGQGLVGQAALTKSMMTIFDLPPDSITISSGLGRAHPVGLLIVPLLYNEQVIGVFEFGLLSEDIEKEKDFLERVSESIAITFNTAQDRTRINHLLFETQRQAEELQVQEEELRTTNEELLEQAKELRSGQARI